MSGFKVVARSHECLQRATAVLRVLPEVSKVWHGSDVLFSGCHAVTAKLQSPLFAVIRDHLHYGREIFKNQIYVPGNTGSIITGLDVHSPSGIEAATRRVKLFPLFIRWGRMMFSGFGGRRDHNRIGLRMLEEKFSGTLLRSIHVVQFLFEIGTEAGLSQQALADCSITFDMGMATAKDVCDCTTSKTMSLITRDGCEVVIPRQADIL